MARDFGADQSLKAADILCVFQGLQADELRQKICHRSQTICLAVAQKQKPDRLQSDPTVIPQINNAGTTASIALHKNFVTVRQMFSDEPAPQIQAFTELRRSPLSSPAAAWPCRKVLLNPAPLSRRLSFSTSYHSNMPLSTPFFLFYHYEQYRHCFTALNC